MFPSRPSSTLIYLAKRFRKPPWIPPSPSKIFRVPKPRPMEPELKAELDEKFSAYNAHMLSITQAMKETVRRSAETTKASESAKLHDEEIEKAQREKDRLELNARWNEEVAKVRIEWMKQADEDERMRRIKAKVDLEAQMQIDSDLVDNYVLRVQEEAQNIISPDQIEEAIEKALDNPVDYNFAIDSDGNKYKNGEIIGNFLLNDQRQQLNDVLES